MAGRILPEAAMMAAVGVAYAQGDGGRTWGFQGANAWHTLAVEARGDRLEVFWEGRPILDAQDDTFRDAGKVGLWTKADSVTYFAALTVKPLS